MEEKISAVEDYLNGIRSVSDIMNDISIKSKRSVRDWILAYQQQGAEALYPLFQSKPCEGSVTYLSAQYGIRSHSTLKRWISVYNSHIELNDYIPERGVYMAEAGRKTMLEEHQEIVEYFLKHNQDYKDTASIYDVSYS